jgi:hypothetical protein
MTCTDTVIGTRNRSMSLEKSAVILRPWARELL